MSSTVFIRNNLFTCLDTYDQSVAYVPMKIPIIKKVSKDKIYR